jgi:hypothetical protein
MRVRDFRVTAAVQSCPLIRMHTTQIAPHCWAVLPLVRETAFLGVSACACAVLVPCFGLELSLATQIALQESIAIMKIRFALRRSCAQPCKAWLMT